MSIVVDKRLRPADIGPVMRDLRGVVEEARRRNTGRCTIALFAGGFLVVAALTASFTVDFQDEGAQVCLPLGALFAALVLYGAVDQRNWVARKAAKVAFVGQVLGGLEEDLHPRSRFKLKLDLRRYDAPGKLVWKGRSSAGNVKLRYSDTWLRVRMLLADHTYVELRQQVGVKTKKGSVVSETRRFFLVVRPSARYDGSAVAQQVERLRKRIKEAIVHEFQDPPEDFHVHVKSHGPELRIGVRQEDAPILAAEVVALVSVVMQFLSRYVRRRAA